MRPFDSAHLTLQATGIWVPEEAVLLLQVFDSSDVMQAQQEVREQQLSLHFGGGFQPGFYSVVVAVVLAGEADDALASVTIQLLLQ